MKCALIIMLFVIILAVSTQGVELEDSKGGDRKEISKVEREKRSYVNCADPRLCDAVCQSYCGSTTIGRCDRWRPCFCIQIILGSILF